MTGELPTNARRILESLDRERLSTLKALLKAEIRKREDEVIAGWRGETYTEIFAPDEELAQAVTDLEARGKVNGVDFIYRPRATTAASEEAAAEDAKAIRTPETPRRRCP